MLPHAYEWMNPRSTNNRVNRFHTYFASARQALVCDNDFYSFM